MCAWGWISYQAPVLPPRPPGMATATDLFSFSFSFLWPKAFPFHPSATIIHPCIYMIWYDDCIYLPTIYPSLYMYLSTWVLAALCVWLIYLYVCFLHFYIIKSIYTSISIPCIYQGNFMANGVYGRKMIILWIQQIPGCISWKGMCQTKIRVGQKIFISKDSAKRKLESVYLKISY